MIRALFTASTGMQAQQLNLDTISHNLANVNTTGFKRSRVDFQDLLYQTLRSAGTRVANGAEVPSGLQVGHGSRAVATQKIFMQGNFQQTENPLDVVIEGAGFFQVLLPDGTQAYSRAGAFKLDGQGRVVTSDGFVLQPSISIPPDAANISIGTDGTVSVVSGNSSSPTEVGKIQLARFSNAGGLNAIGRNLYLPTAASGNAVVGQPASEGLGALSQGFLEMSNVSVVEEMVNLIAAQRAFEVNAKAVQTADEMLNQANNMRR